MRKDRSSPIALIISAIVLIGSLLFQSPAMALTGDPFNSSLAARIMSKAVSASAKQVEGRLQSAAGDITGNTSDKIKGQAKQVQAPAMQAGSDLKQGVKSKADKLGDSISRATDKTN